MNDHATLAVAVGVNTVTAVAGAAVFALGNINVQINAALVTAVSSALLAVLRYTRQSLREAQDKAVLVASRIAQLEQALASAGISVPEYPHPPHGSH